ncbi:MAG: hypothetical protein IID44_18240 [Planctomycetes bacterium]|nr:hypothetical protein [Planctomycetota bacterium]
MLRHGGKIYVTVAGMLLTTALAGCGTTRWTDTGRTATEQLLISDAVDRSVSQIDFSSLRGRTVFFDATYLKGVTDEQYVVSTLRQHLFASGCIIKEKREDAIYVVEARSGAVGTDRADVLYGVPATTIPQLVAMPGVPTTIPEIALGRKTEQHGVAKLAVFVYNRETGRAVWQSGTSNVVSHAKDIWVLGIGPFRRGTIYSRPQFVGSDMTNSWLTDDASRDKSYTPVRVARQLHFRESPVANQPADPKQAANRDTAQKATADTPPPDAGAPPLAGPPAADPPAENQPPPDRWSNDIQRLPQVPSERIASPPRYFY